MFNYSWSGRFFVNNVVFRVDGGVSRNDYICQTIANVTSTTVIRMKNNNRTEVSCLGAAFMAGLLSGMLFIVVSF